MILISSVAIITWLAPLLLAWIAVLITIGIPAYNEENNITEIIKKSVNEITGLDAEFSTTGGTSDARFFKDYCEVAEFGLIGETAHQVNENVSIEDINKLENIYKNILINYFIIIP